MTTTMATRMQGLLPAVYRESDAAISGLPLAGLLSLFGPSLDSLKTLIDGLPSLVDVATCPEAFLPYLGALVGYEFDPDLTATAQRQAIRDCINRYRRRGTEYQLLRDLALLLWPGELQYTYPHTMRLVSRSKLTAGQRLSGYRYSFGVYIITKASLTPEFLQTVYWHHPAGARLILLYDTVYTSGDITLTTAHAYHEVEV